MNRKWLGRDKVRCIVLKEKGSKAEEKIHDLFCKVSLKRVVLIISYEVISANHSNVDVSKIC